MICWENSCLFKTEIGDSERVSGLKNSEDNGDEEDKHQRSLDLLEKDPGFKVSSNRTSRLKEDLVTIPPTSLMAIVPQS